MDSTASRLRASGAKLATLLGTASLLTLANAIADRDRAFGAEAGEMVAQVPDEIPENVLITGSLIRGTVAVGVPVVNLSPMDFATTGALTTADLFKNFPAANIMSGDIGTATGARIDRGQKVNLRNLDSPDATRALMLVDGMRTAPSGNGVCALDPSIIPSIALDHIDILVDGASATYGSDAETGVFSGAITTAPRLSSASPKEKAAATGISSANCGAGPPGSGSTLNWTTFSQNTVAARGVAQQHTVEFVHGRRRQSISRNG